MWFASRHLVAVQQEVPRISQFFRTYQTNKSWRLSSPLCLQLLVVPYPVRSKPPNKALQPTSALTRRRV